MPSEPLISVIIPTYNEAATLDLAVMSILNQTYRNLEVLIVDDFSTDETAAIADRLTHDDPRVRYIPAQEQDRDPHRVDWRGVNISVGYMARNRGLEQAKGEWITFQDADDVSVPNRLEVQLRLATTYRATLITTGWLPFREEYLGKTLDTAAFEKAFPEPVALPKTIKDAAASAKGILMNNWFPHSFIPFEIKKRLLRPLFWGNTKSYPGADNSMFFIRDVITHVRFRQRDKRIWPALSGRGVGRDFVFQVAETFKNSYSFRHPLYLWRISTIPLQSDELAHYLI